MANDGYIKKSDAESALLELRKGFRRVDEKCAVGACILEIQDLPTVNAVEVVHGEWEITEDDYFDFVEMKCSVCGESYGFEDYEDDTPKNYHYCPNCGAKMDGDGNA